MTRTHLFWAIGTLLVAGIFTTLVVQQGTFITIGPLDLNAVKMGEIGTVCLLFAVAYVFRKRLGIGAVGWLGGWLWMHIYLGLLGTLFIWFHSRQRFTWDTAALPNAAMILLIFTAVSGIVGRLLYVVVPRFLERLPDYDPPRALQQRIGALELEASSFAALKSGAFRALYDQLLQRPLEFAPAAPAWGWLEQGRAALPPQEVEDFDRAAALLLKRGELLATLGRRRRYRLVLDVWWKAHVWLTEAGTIFAAIHIVDSLLRGRW